MLVTVTVGARHADADLGQHRGGGVLGGSGQTAGSAAAPVAEATVHAPAARNVLALSSLRDMRDLRVGPVDGRSIRNTAAAPASSASSASVLGCAAPASTATTGW